MKGLSGGTTTRPSGGGDHGGDSAGANGHGPGDGREPSAFAQPAPQRPAGPSTRLALIVLGIAAVLTVLGSLAAVLTSSQGRPAAPAGSSSGATRSPLPAVPARPTLAPLVSGGLPPLDVLGSVTLPRSTALVPASATDNGVGLYDHSVGLTVPASEQAVIGFFRVALPRGHWRVLSQGTAPGGGYRVIGQRPGSNGYEWELGVTVMPETFSGSSSTGTSPSGTTPFTLRLFEVSDAQ